MRVLIGLGNPGLAYQKTPHNIGFWVMDLLAERWGIPLVHRTCVSLIGEGQLNNETLVLVQPQTYMNNSGKAVSCIQDAYGVSPSDFLVVHDDLDLPAGRVRIKRGGGGAGGNRGVASIIEELGSKAFPRVKIGIGRPQDRTPIPDFVLRRFTPQEEASMLCAARHAADAVGTVLTQGLEQAMDDFNRSGATAQG